MASLVQYEGSAVLRALDKGEERLVRGSLQWSLACGSPHTYVHTHPGAGRRPGRPSSEG